MDIAILADLHSNHYALEECIDDCKKRKITHFIFLGDYAGELPNTHRTMDILDKLRREASCFFIKGNREDYMIEHAEQLGASWLDNTSASGALLNTYEELTSQDIDFFKSLSKNAIYEVPGMPPVFCCHGSGEKTNEYVRFHTSRSREILETYPCDYILYGHTHIQGLEKYQNKILINPGAVGTPIESENANTQYAILHSTKESKWDVEFVSLSYPLEECVNELYHSNLPNRAPCWTILTEYCIRFGVAEQSTNVLKRAMELCESRTGKCIWPDIPEQFWHEALKEYHIVEELEKYGDPTRFSFIKKSDGNL